MYTFNPQSHGYGLRNQRQSEFYTTGSLLDGSSFDDDNSLTHRVEHYSKILGDQYDEIQQSLKRGIHSKRDSQNDSKGETKSVLDVIPEVKRVNTYESGSDNSSDEHVVPQPELRDHRGGRNEVTEAAAHELRRQRLAQSPSFLITSTLKYTAGACSPLQSSLASTNCNQRPANCNGSLRRPQGGRLSVPSPPSVSFESQPTEVASNLNKREKHVAFKEPTASKRRSDAGTNLPASVGKTVEDYSCWSVPLKRGGMDPTGHRIPEQMSEDSDDDTSIFAFRNAIENIKPDATRDHGEKVERQQNATRRTLNSDAKQVHPNTHTVTVHKNSKEEKIGIFLQLHKFEQGNRLVVSHISPTGKFANTGIEFGDIVVSINSQDMVKNPKTEKALEIVTTATGKITIVVQKGIESDDTQSATQTTISSISKDFSSFTDGNSHGLKPPKSNLNSEGKVRKREKMAGDGSMLISKDTEIKGPVSITTNESWKLSGVIVVNIEKSYPSENPGIRFGSKETPAGRVIYISEMSPSSPFTNTPIRTGDIILSINNMNLYNTNVIGAYSALGKSGQRITLVAKKGGESLNDFLLDGRGQSVNQEGKSLSGQPSIISLVTAGTVGTTISGGSERGESSFSEESLDDTLTDGVISFSPNRIRESNTQKKSFSTPSTTRDDFEFDEQSYGASLFGYNASSTITIVKTYRDEDVGLELMVISTEWGRLLAVSRISPRSLASDTDLKVGDAILTINGTSLRRNPSVERASSLVRGAPRLVTIEFQKLSSFSPAVPMDRTELQVKENETPKLKSTNSPESHTSQSLEELLGKEKLFFSGGPLSSGQQKEGEFQSSPCRPKSSGKRQKLRVIVTKEYKGQEVGIDVQVVNDNLIVKKVSSKGLLRNAPLVYGDTILSINGVSFKNDPDVEEAVKVVKNAPRQVAFEVLKTKNIYDEKSDEKTKSCVPKLLFCSRRKEEEKVNSLKGNGQN